MTEGIPPRTPPSSEKNYGVHVNMTRDPSLLQWKRGGVSAICRSHASEVDLPRTPKLPQELWALCTTSV
jgi:hypothetical protein